MKVHMRSTRHFVNAGMNFPLCRTNEDLLDLDASGWPMEAYPDFVTCDECLKRAREWYNNEPGDSRNPRRLWINYSE